MSKSRVLVFGMMGQTPFAGVAWQTLHYLEGLRRLGHDVYYIEDTGAWPYDPEQNTITDNPRYTVNYIAWLMSWAGMQDRWAYVSAAGRNIFGLSAGQVSELLRHSDALINLTGSTLLRDEHSAIPIRIYLETDPVTPQIEITQGKQFTIDLLMSHTHHFTYGENIGAADCGVPVTNFQYRPTRPPVVLEWWEAGTIETRSCYTTIANWKQSGKDIVWNGETYTWSKHYEFLKFLGLAARAGPVELALACDDPEVWRLLARHGWCVADACKLSRDILPYRDYILTSRAEFTVAKDQNIRLCSGWFSDRSVCYLAASRPVVTQDTGFGKRIPAGEGLFAFRNMEEAVAAIQQIESDYTRHAHRARKIAEEYFQAEVVLRKLLNESDL
jgi:hypothetical protein